MLRSGIQLPFLGSQASGSDFRGCHPALLPCILNPELWTLRDVPEFIHATGVGVSGFRFLVSGLGFGVWGLGFKVPCFRLWVSGFGVRFSS